MPTILRTLDIMTIIQPVFPPCSDPNPTLSTQQAISVTVVLGDKLVSQICQAKSPGCYLRAMGPRAPVSGDHCIYSKQQQFNSLSFCGFRLEGLSVCVPEGDDVDTLHVP